MIQREDWQRKEKEPRLLTDCFPPAEFDVKLCGVIYEAIGEKVSLNPERRQELARKITDSLGYLSNAYNFGFVEEVDALVGSKDYNVWVYLRKDTRVLEAE